MCDERAQDDVGFSKVRFKLALFSGKSERIEFRFLIGREKEPEKSEIFALIQRSLQLDQQREDISQTFQQYHDAYYEQNFNDEEEVEFLK